MICQKDNKKKNKNQNKNKNRKEEAGTTFSTNNVPKEWFEVNIGSVGDVSILSVDGTKTGTETDGSIASNSISKYIVPRPTFDISLELEMNEEKCPINIHDLIHGKHQCSQVCLEIMNYTMHALNTHASMSSSSDIFASVSSASGKTSKNKWCRYVKSAGRRINIPSSLYYRQSQRNTELYNFINLQIWMEDYNGDFISKKKDIQLEIQDIVTIQLTTASNSQNILVPKISFNIPVVQKWMFRSDLYVMCGTYRQEQNSANGIHLKCQPLDSMFYIDQKKEKEIIAVHGDRRGHLQLYLQTIDGSAFGYSEWIRLLELPIM